MKRALSEEKRKLVMLPGPTNVPDRVMRAMLKPIINHRSEAFTKLQKSVMEKAKKVFETSNDIVIFTSSGTGGVEAAISNLIKKGDNVIVTVFGEFGSRVAEEVRYAGGNVITVDAPLGDAPRMDELERAFEKNKDVKAVIVVHNETSTGATFRWLRELSELVAKYGAFFVVDAISILGGDELSVDKLGIDVCITGTQKCLAAPPGLAIISISERAKKYIIENPPPYHYFNLPRYFKYAEIGETPFTPSIPLYYALEEALQLVLEEGLERRFKRHRVCAKAFYSSLQSIGIEPACKEDVRSNTVLAFKYPRGIEDLKFRNYLDKRHDVLVARGFGELRGKVFRIGCMGIVNEEIVLTTVKALSSTLNDFGYKNSIEECVEVARKELKELS